MRHRLLPLLVLCACTPGAQEHTFTASIYGEEFIEEAIPAEEFVDGWSVTFDRFLVSVGEITVADEAAGAEAMQYKVFDLATASGGRGFEVLQATRSGSGYDDVGYVIGPSPDPLPGAVDDAGLELMRTGGYSIYVEGEATRGVEAVRFAWGFATRTTYHACEAANAGDGDVAVQLTIHGDHLFTDDLFSETPNVAFDLIAAADADDDGQVTAAELRAVDITTEARYQVGDLTDIKDLWSFIEQQTTSLGHIDGEGHCEATRAE